MKIKRFLSRVPFLLADIGEGIKECKITKWYVKEGEQVKQFDKICDAQSDKATVEITSRFSGEIKKFHYQINDVAQVGSPLLDIETNDSKVSVEETVLAAPSVRALARKNGIDITKVKGSGKDGRVLATDLNLEQNKKKMALTLIQKTMFQQMTNSLTIPHLIFCDEYRVNTELPLFPFLIKTFSTALEKFPILNGHLVEENIEFNDTQNIGIAVDSKMGLVVPNIKNVQAKSINDIYNELVVFKKNAETNNFKPADFINTTTTLSNIGAIGGTYMGPVIVPPQLFIAAIGKKNNDKVCLSFAADHRIIDGATVAKFSNMWKEMVENPTEFIKQLK